MNAEVENKIARALGNCIYYLSDRKAEYGIGFDLRDDGDLVYLDLFDSDSRHFTKIVKTLSAKPNRFTENSFIESCVRLFENQVYNL
jgi:hypothetical protein